MSLLSNLHPSSPTSAVHTDCGVIVPRKDIQPMGWNPTCLVMHHHSHKAVRVLVCLSQFKRHHGWWRALHLLQQRR